MNVNPAMHTNCITLSTICPQVVQETLGRESIFIIELASLLSNLIPIAAIAIEVFGKCRRNKSPIPISELKHFRILVPKS